MRLLPLLLLAPLSSLAAQETPVPVALTIQTRSAVCTLSTTGQLTTLRDLASRSDYAVPAPFASLKQGGKRVPATTLAASPARLAPGQTARVTVGFGDGAPTAVLRVRAGERHFTVEVSSVSGTDLDELTFCEVRTKLKGQREEGFALAGMALNTRTDVPGYPAPATATRAACVPRFGLQGAKVAVVACPWSELRAEMQQVVAAAPELPHSTLGGPWALDQAINAGSYLFNFGGMSEQTVGDWIACAESIGFNQIDFHGGSSFRFGDFLPNPETYPRGYASLKAVIDRLHEHGIKAGLHTYAFFIDKRSPYVTPVPDPRLAKAHRFTLAAELSATADSIAVNENTEKISAITGFFVRNSNTVQVGEELITFSGVTTQPPYAFTGCRRGACGTRAAAHPAGAAVGHLKECFGLFVPDPKTDMLAEIAAKTAEIYNACGFDMIYLDALDGEDILGGAENSWHYGSQFVFEICRRLNRPALMEMSTFHHHLWYARSRIGAWDHPNRSHKYFIGLHCQANESGARMFLPATLGWWALKTWGGQDGEPTFTDDIEYLCGKAVGYGHGLALMGINPDNYQKLGSMKQLGPILKRYEDLRHAGAFSPATREKLRALGDEYTLLPEQGTPAAGESWRLQPIQYARHKVEGLQPATSHWQAENRFGAQPAQLRIQALLSPAPYEAPGTVEFLDPAAPGVFTEQAAAPGVTLQVQPATNQIRGDTPTARLTAKSTLPTRTASWARLGHVFSPPVSIAATPALGLWVYGDGKGEVLNFQLHSPAHLNGESDHYVVVDFTGWRYVELVEPEGERYADYKWPYGNIYSVYREGVRRQAIERLNVWVNNLPPGEEVTCYLSRVRALPLAETALTNPTVTVGGRTVTFPVAVPTGHYLQARSLQDCTLFDKEGNPVSQVTPTGQWPALEAGANEVAFGCAADAAGSRRAFVWVVSRGEPFAIR